LLWAIAELTDRNGASYDDADTPDSHPDFETNLAAWERHPGERKPATMLFADIAGSTALTKKLDAEEAHDLLYGATQRMCESVEKYQGTRCAG
jgi:class 3 adenylate cyclase